MKKYANKSSSLRELKEVHSFFATVELNNNLVGTQKMKKFGNRK